MPRWQRALVAYPHHRHEGRKPGALSCRVTVPPVRIPLWFPLAYKNLVKSAEFPGRQGNPSGQILRLFLG